MFVKFNLINCLSVGVFPLFIISCADPGSPIFRQKQAQKLSCDLQKLAPVVSAYEADQMAITAVEEAAKLSRDYKPARLAWFNNWLVNRGLRERGLCYHWRDDLFLPLFQLKLSTLDLHLATSRQGTVLEHNGIVVTARNQPFNQGIIIDAWRQGGRLWWGRFNQDKNHPWKKLKRDHTPMVLRPLLMPKHYPKTTKP